MRSKFTLGRAESRSTTTVKTISVALHQCSPGILLVGYRGLFIKIMITTIKTKEDLIERFGQPHPDPDSEIAEIVQILTEPRELGLIRVEEETRTSER